MWNQTLGCQLPSETSLLLCAPGRVDYIYTVRKTWTPWSSQLTHVQLTQGLSRKGKCCYLSSRDPGQFLALTGHAQTTPVTRGGPQTTWHGAQLPNIDHRRWRCGRAGMYSLRFWRTSSLSNPASFHGFSSWHCCLPPPPGCLCERSHHIEASCPPTHIPHSWLGGCQADSCPSVLPQLQPSPLGLVLDFSSLISPKRGSFCLMAATITSQAGNTIFSPPLTLLPAGE